MKERKIKKKERRRQTQTCEGMPIKEKERRRQTQKTERDAQTQLEFERGRQTQKTSTDRDAT